MKKYVLMVVLAAALIGCEKPQQSQPTAEWLPLTGKVSIGAKVYLGTHDYIGQIVQIDNGHTFPDGSIRNGLRIQSPDGGDFWIPRNTAEQMYITRATDDKSKATVSNATGSSQAPINILLGIYTVNLMPEKSGDMHIMQASITLNVTKPELEGKIRERMPEIHSRLNTLLSGKYASELRGEQGAEKLANEVKVQVENLLGVTDVMKVLITSLLIA